MLKVEKINPSTLALPPEGMHAHITVAPRGARLAFIAGQVALDQDFAIIGDDIGCQAVQCFTNIRLALDALGAHPNQIVQMSIIVVDYNQSELDGINASGKRVFGDDWPVTATTLIGAKALGHNAFKIEVSAVVALYD
jgi:enamine deaminase RidA (YjgF/YER057c/UK114 family)